MDLLSFTHPFVSVGTWKWQRGFSSCRTEHVFAASLRPKICRCKVENASSQQKNVISRRCFALQTLALLLSTIAAPAVNAAPPRRTVFDEERELSAQMHSKDEEDRRNALRAAFEAVDMASQQLGDVTVFVKEENWNGLRQFTRLFNNSVEREGMEPLTRRLTSKQKRQDSLMVCRQLTQALQSMDQNAKREDGDGVLADLQKTRQLIAAFQEFKP